MNNLPKYITRFLGIVCPSSLTEEIEGDLLQRFEKDIAKHGSSKAKRKLLWNTLAYFRSEILLRNTFKVFHQKNEFIMIGNYLKVMWRHIGRHKTNSFINVAGLTTGITFSLVIGVYVWGELQVNQQLKDVDQLYIFEGESKLGSTPEFFIAPTPLSKSMAEEYPTKVESYYRFWDRMVKISAGDKHFVYQSMIGDSTLLSMTGLPVLYGDRRTALKEPYSVVITETVAEQLFGRSDVVGETVGLSSGTPDEKQFRITAVLPALESNSITDIIHINSQVFMSFANRSDFLMGEVDVWDDGMCLSYLKVAKGASISELEDIAMKMTKERVPSQFQNDVNIHLKPLGDYYVLSGNGAVLKMLYLLGGIALFILLLATINFINISISGTSARLKEIGVRKVIGGLKKQIVFQFLSESVLLTIFAGVCSLVLYEVFRGFFAEILGGNLISIFQLSPGFWKWSTIGVVMIGVLAGLYPAVLLSAYKTIDSLKGKIRSVSNKNLLSKGLITIQFSISIFVFICAIVISRQISLFLESDLGYDKSYVLTVSSVPRIWSSEGVNTMAAAKQEFLTIPQVQHVSLSWEVPNGNTGRDISLYPSGTDKTKALNMPMFVSDEDFASVFQMEVLDGHFYHEDGGSWKLHDMVINESASKALGLKVGDKMKMPNIDTIEFTVTGILKDFVFNSMHQAVKPMTLIHPKEIQAYRFLSFRLQPGNVVESVAAVERKWREVFPDDPFDYAFMEDRLASMYKSEMQLRKASAVGTGVMTVIVIVGLLGIVSLAVSRRFKEIGIRKVLGASVWTILRLFFIEYMKIILIAIAIAIPLAWLQITNWLNGFAFRVELSWWMFAVPGLLLMAIALLVVIVSTRKAAVSNPVDAIRLE